MRLFLRVRPKKKGGRPSNSNSILSKVEGRSDTENLLGNWIVFSETSSRWNSGARSHDS